MKQKELKILKCFPLFCSGLALIFSIIYNMYHHSKVYIIDDNSYLFGLINNSIPNGLYIEDLVWGAVNIEDSEYVLEFYDFLSHLGVADEENIESDEGQKLQGNIYFTGGKSMAFTFGNYIYLEGVIYGSKSDRPELKRYMNLLRKKLYTKEHLGKLVNAQNKVEFRMEQKRKKLAIDQKKQLKQMILNADFFNYQKDSSEQIQNKGKVVSQIEFYVGEKAIAPQVYIAIYESGLCLVYDSFANQSGSIMQFKIKSRDIVDFMKGVQIEKIK